MRYKSFRIRNFKGIKDTTISLEGIAGAAVFAFVGLNESGKTTLLEAIHSFSPDEATSELIGGEAGTGVPFRERVPRHMISSFSGNVSVSATIVLSKSDKKQVSEDLLGDHELLIDVNDFPDEVVLERRQIFRGGDFIRSELVLQTSIKVKKKRQKRWREAAGEEKDFVRDAVYGYTPDIAYFPTFIFDFPERTFLTERGSAVDAFYRTVFQDILDFDGKGFTIEKDIVRRVRSDGMIVPWPSFLNLWKQHDDQNKIQHVMDRASAAVTRLVFGRWNQIFGEDTRGKEVVIGFDIVEGEKVDDSGAKSRTQEHDVYVTFQIRDGTRRFKVKHRSLGFRWFFAFMLFTQFRVARAVTRPLLFLFDEPASNLHAAAQQKLIESFPEITRDEHTLAYTTHSHYMIEPKWLEQTFIVTNRADAPLPSMLDEVSLDDESLDIKVATYRSFVNEYPNHTSYFQPILDRLKVVPSRFDLDRASVVVEGKSDYYILRYANRLTGKDDLALLPGLGAGTFGALAALHVGWNLNFIFLLDGDHQGKTERDRYSRDFGMTGKRLLTLDELVDGIERVENLLDDKALDVIQRELRTEKAPSKGQIKRFFQERLASDQIQALSPDFERKSKQLLNALKDRLASCH